MRIPIREGFTVLPEGVYIFKLSKVHYDEDFGKLTMYFETKSGQKATKRFGLLDNNGEWVEGAINSFSYFARNLMGEQDIEDVEPAELVGHYVQAIVTHDVKQSEKDPTKTVTYVNIGDLEPVAGFEEDEEVIKQEPSAEVISGNINIPF